MQGKYKDIHQAARLAGACDRNGLKLIESARSIGDLISLMKSPQGIEFCMRSRFPSADKLSEHEDELLKSSVFYKGEHDLKNPRLVVCFGGVVNIQLEGFEVCEVYATNDAVINLTVKDNAFASVEMHHESTLNKAVSGSGRVVIGGRYV